RARVRRREAPRVPLSRYRSRRHRYRFLQWRDLPPRSERSGILPEEMSGPARCQTRPAKLFLGRCCLLRCARQFLCYFRCRTLNHNAVLVIEADLDLTRLVSFHNDTNERGVDEQQPRSECRLKENEHYTTHVSCCLPSATVAWIASEIVAIRAA